MMEKKTGRSYLIISGIAHGLVLLAIIVSVNFSSPTPVIENTNKQDVISAVVLGDSAKSKIMPNQPPKPTPPPIKEEPKPEPKPEPPKPVEPPKPKEKPPETAKMEAVEKDVIALKAMDKKKKLAEQKAEAAKKLHEMLAKDFLADMNDIKKKTKKADQKKLASQFEKTLQEQAEKSLREQLLNEEIKLKGTQSRQAQGEVNKYKALILQAISEQWIVPTQANKKLSCELMIRLAPGGLVMEVQVTKSSGDPSLDSSARAAVLKASPLPVPKNSDAFESFRQFALKVKPENILASASG